MEAANLPATAPRPTLPATSQIGRRWFVAALSLSGLFFLLYPAIRPFSDEASMRGADAFASPAWIVAHTFGVLAFLLLGIGAFGLYLHLQDGILAGRSLTAALLIWVGVGLTLPYYGAEMFGLHAVGQQTAATGDVTLLTDLTHAIRWDVGIWFILLGLALLAAGTIVLATAVWRAGRLARASAVPLAVGMALYIPQFSGPQPVRIAHGLLMAAGCGWLAWGLNETAPQ
jgi:hypothetical protein